MTTAGFPPEVEARLHSALMGLIDALPDWGREELVTLDRLEDPENRGLRLIGLDDPDVEFMPVVWAGEEIGRLSRTRLLTGVAVDPPGPFGDNE